MVPDNQLYLAAFTGGLACTAPLIHFILIKQGLNIFIATSLILSTILSFPAIFGNLHLGYVTILGLSLRLIDTALHGTVVLRELSLQEYLQYYLSFKVKATKNRCRLG